MRKGPYRLWSCVILVMDVIKGRWDQFEVASKVVGFVCVPSM